MGISKNSESNSDIETKPGPLSAIRRRGWPAWVALLIVIVLIVEVILICGSSSLFNLIIPIAADLERPTDPTTTRTAVNSIAFSPDQVILATGSGDGVVRLWQMVDGSLMRPLKASDRPISSIAFSPDGSFLAVGAWDGRVSLWQSDAGYLHSQILFDHPVRSIAYHPQQDVIAVGTLAGKLYLWEPLTGLSPLELDGHTDWINQLRFSPNGDLLASAGNDGQIRLWDSITGQLNLALKPQDNEILDVVFAPSGDVLVNASFDQGLTFWQIPRGDLLNKGHYQSPIWKLDFSHDGQWLAIGSQGFMDLWQFTDGTVIRTSQTPWPRTTRSSSLPSLLSLAFAPSENLLAVGARDGRVILWQVEGDGNLSVTRDWFVE
ncbi:MAG: WD40 repeat domain-containing protein [Chloroflexota bacterium]